MAEATIVRDRSAVVIRGCQASWLLALVAACFNPRYNHTACGPGNACPDGLTCGEQGICEPLDAGGTDARMPGPGELDAPGGPGGPDTPGPGPGGSVTATWTLDSAAELGAAGSVLQNMTVEARGSLTPTAYTYGGLIAHGKQGTKLWAHNDTSWSKLTGVTPTGAALWRGESFTNTSQLDYVGIANRAIMTIWFEGEVWLEAGSTQTFSLDADDVAFIDLARPGTSAFQQVMENGPVPVAVATPETGWYPIRIGFSDGDNNSRFAFSHSDTGTASVPWTRDRLRARASEVRGVLRTVNNVQLLGGGLGASQPISQIDEQGDLLTLTTFNTLPQGVRGNDDWSARYFAQLYVAQAGMYRLRVASDDGNRVRLGATARGESHWVRDDGDANASSDVQTNLVAGWNDVVVDYNQVAGSKKLQVLLEGPGVASAPVPAERLRPVEPAEERLVYGSDATAHAVPENGGASNPATARMTIAGFAGETVTSLDVMVDVETSRFNELSVDLETPGGTRVTIRNTGIFDIDGIAQVTIPATAQAPRSTLLNGPANGTWKLHVFDIGLGGERATLVGANVTLHTTGGPEKIAKTASWLSRVLDASTNVFAIDEIVADQRVPAGAAIKLLVRTCQTASCDGAAWRDIAPPFNIARGRYLQLRADMTSDGSSEPELKNLSVMYRRDQG